MTDNDNLELKKRSRRRLVGAAALAMIAAIILPMVMDDEPGIPVQEIQVTIPDRNADSLLARPIGGRAPTPAELTAAPAPFEQPAEPGPPLDATPPVAAQERVAPVPRESVPDKALPADAPKRATVQSPEEPDDEAARVKAILEGRLFAEATGEGSFVVQVGAFGETGKAVALSADLKGRGFNAFTEDAGAVTRVRVGPFASRSEAQKAAERLGAQGLNGVVTVR